MYPAPGFVMNTSCTLLLSVSPIAVEIAIAVAVIPVDTTGALILIRGSAV